MLLRFDRLFRPGLALETRVDLGSFLGDCKVKKVVSFNLLGLLSPLKSMISSNMSMMRCLDNV